MMEGNTVYKEAFDVSTHPKDGTTLTWAENTDCLLLGKELTDNGYNPAILNFSNQGQACGDIDRGVKGQEQDILRRTNLSKAHSQIFTEKWSGLLGVRNRGNAYPLNSHFGCVYTPEVTVFRMSDFFAFTLLDEPFKLAIISIGAKTENNDREETLRVRIRTIFRVGLDKGHDSLVLGGWGCGADGNSPADIASLFKTVSEEPEFKDKYRAIAFACASKPSTRSELGRFAPFGEIFGTEKP